MELIELHILQSFPVSCLNRDDVGAPKSAVFGGVQRARVSSQSWKRAIRTLAQELQPAYFGGTRTRFVVRELASRYVDRGVEERQATALAAATADALGKLDSAEKGNVKTLLYFSPQEFDNVVDAMLAQDCGEHLPTAADAEAPEKQRQEAHKELVKLAEKPAKALGKQVKDAADIAVFGRMVADDHSLMLEGAGLFSHALSTHRVSNDIDFFSAVDDLQEDDEGAGHIGTLEFNSACYYRYVGINLHLLRDAQHLGHFSGEELRAVLSAVLQASIEAVPVARRNSMFAYTRPAYALGLRRTGQPLSLVNAFEQAVRASDRGFVEPSVEKLEDHFEHLKKTYGLKAAAHRMPPDDIGCFIKALVEKSEVTPKESQPHERD